jgi:hypothetical protein
LNHITITFLPDHLDARNRPDPVYVVEATDATGRLIAPPGRDKTPELAEARAMKLRKGCGKEYPVASFEIFRVELKGKQRSEI